MAMIYANKRQFFLTATVFFAILIAIIATDFGYHFATLLLPFLQLFGC